MPLVLNASSVVLCAHGGPCMPAAPEPRVKASGAPVIAQSSPWTVAGCPAVAQPPGGCLTVQFVTGSVRVKVGGKPILLNTSVGIATPSAAPVTIANAQVRVKAT
jgi:hypothetical protein